MRQQQTQIRKLLARQLERDEVKIVLAVKRAEEKRAAYHAGRLGIAGSLERRGWLMRDPDGNLHLSSSTRDLLAEFVDEVRVSRAA